MSKFHIPDTLDGVNSLLTTQKWEKAAIVWAYVHCPGAGFRSDLANFSEVEKSYTPESFAALGITGLRSKDSVRTYWQRWQEAIDTGQAKPVVPGGTVEIPSTPWVSTDDDNRAGSANRHVSRQQIANAVKADPTIIEEVYQEDRGVREATRRASEKRHNSLVTEGSGSKITCDGPRSDTEIGRLVGMVDGVIDEASRRDGLRMLKELAEAIDTQSKAWAETWGATGEPDEIEQIQTASSHLRSAQARISTFAVNTNQKDVTK